MDDLPSDYDVIVIGTGMTESIVAAAASRIGKRVLHLDSNEYYGGMWAAFNFDGLQKWLGECQNKSSELKHETTDNLLKDGESLIKAGSQFATVFNIEEKWFIPKDLVEKEGEPLPSKDTQTEGDGEQAKGEREGDLEKGEKESSENEKEKDSSQSKCWSQSKLKSLYRKFNLDLAPKLLYSRGSLVELLISSNIARYAEFRSVSRVLTYINDKLETVPCSRADVFSTKEISVVEKRMLMQLLTLCHEYAKDPNNKEFLGFEDKTFVEYLDSKKLTSNLLHYVLYAIAMSTHKTPCMEGVERTQRFLTSLGRYGNTPFLWPMYGSGELPQCFCRLCAVFGGVYHLKRAANSVIISQKAGEPFCPGIVSGSQRLATEHLVMAVSDAPKSFLQSAPTGGLSRGIFLTDRSILAGNKEMLTLLQFPPQDANGELVTVIEVGPSTNACPQGLYVLHMISRQVKSAREDLAPAVATLLHTEPCEGTYRSDTLSQATITHKQDSTDVEGADISQAEVQSVKPQLLWSLYFNCPETSSCDLSADVPTNVHLCSGPDLDLDFEFAVKQAKDIFKKMYPDCEFLPRAPDPEEIVLDDDSEPGPAFIDNKSESEQKEDHDKQGVPSSAGEKTTE